MLDYSKFGPANSPTPDTQTTAPVAPSAPGSLTVPSPTVDLGGGAAAGGPTGYKPGNSGQVWSATQEDVDNLNPGEKMARGIDILGNALFGQGNGSPLGGIPLLGDIVGAGGNLAHGILTVPEKVGIEAPATVLSHIPTSYLTGADSTFDQIGAQIKDNPQYAQVYAEYQKVKLAANADVLGGGNMKADFNTEFLKMVDDQQKDSMLGPAPGLAIGASGTGSVGGMLSHAIDNFLGLGGALVQDTIGSHTPLFDPYYSGRPGPGDPNATGGINYLLDAAAHPNKYVVSPGASTSLNIDTMNDFERYAVQQVQSGKMTPEQAQTWIDQNINTKLDRADEALARAKVGLEVSDVEKVAIDAWQKGDWSKQHAIDYMVAHGQGITRNPLGQALGAIVTDPLTYATLGAGKISSLGVEGKALLEAGDVAGELSNMQKLAISIARVQDGPMGPAFRRARGLFDPLAVYKPNTVARATTDLVNGAALDGTERALGAQTVKDFRADMREVGMGVEGDTHMASYALDKAHEVIAQEKAVSLIDEGFGEAMIRGEIPVDETVRLAAQNAGRDAATKVADYVQRISKVTFTPEELRSLPARLASVYGKDTSFWAAKVKGASDDLKAMYHAMSYKGGEKDFVQSVAKIDRAKYAEEGGKLPLDNMVLMNSETMDDVIAKQVSAAVKATLASTDGNSIERAAAEWNDFARRYPGIDSIGYAKGNEQQIEALIKELDRKIEAGAITKRAMPEELRGLAPVQDFLDRHTMPMTDAERVTAQQEFEQEAEKVAIKREALESKLAATQTASGRARAGMKDARDAAKASLDRFNEIHPPDEFAQLPEDLPLWRVGFRPDEEVAWGVSRDPITGAVRYDRNPTISHVVDAVPGRQKFSDTTRNVMGQIIGKSNAERLNKPIDSLEAMMNTMTDGITGQRLVTNIEHRFERSTFDIGIPKSLSKELMARAKDVAGMNTTTLRGVNPANVWKSVGDLVPRDLLLKDGTYLNQHIIMDHLLQAAEGDLRILGATSKLTQRMRNEVFRHGDSANWLGQMTVTGYNRVRYAQPMFVIQRVGDAIYYSILYGFKPVGKTLTGVTKEMQAILDNMGRTGFARHFSMDMPEYATHSNFRDGIKSLMQQRGLLESAFDKVHSAPDAIIAANMTNMTYHRMGDIVRGALDNLVTAAEKADPSIRAEMMAEAENLTTTFGEFRRLYSESAGRVLDDNETAMRWFQDHLQAGRRAVTNADGTQDFTGLMREADVFGPDHIGQIESIRPDWLAHEISNGYADAAALRKDVVGSVQKVNGTFQLVPGEHSLKWLEQQLRDVMHMHPDKINRAMAYFSGDWDSFWYKLSRPVEKGGLGISQHYAKEAQAVIADAAKARGMDPWEYLSGTMQKNIGAESLEDNMTKLIRFLQTGKQDQPLEAWSELFRGHLDVSSQQTLLAHFENSAEGSAINEQVLANSLKPAEWKMVVPKSAPGKAARPPVAELPDAFKPEPGYAYRVETPEVMRMGLPERQGVTVGKPTGFYQGKDDINKAIYRIKDDGSLAVGRHGPGGADRLTTKAVPPEDIEMLTADGWKPLSSDPMTTIFGKDFPNLLRQRAASGVPHPNPEVEGYMQAFSKWLKANVSDAELATRTRGDLRSIVESIPTNHATNFNRTHDLIVSLVKDKIADAQQDVFRLAEMQTKRTVIERSLNHPLFGLYPSSYMWGKVLPETIKFLAKNPYAATYIIHDVQRAIAVQREYDPDVEHLASTMDRSATMFLLDYLTPGLPWSDHEARLSPMVRDLFNGKDPYTIFQDELSTVSPERWVKQFYQSAKEVPGAIDALGGKDTGQIDPAVQALQGISGSGSGSGGPSTSTGTPGAPSQITGTVPGAALAPILAGDFERLQSILIDGKDAATP